MQGNKLPYILLFWAIQKYVLILFWVWVCIFLVIFPLHIGYPKNKEAAVFVGNQFLHKLEEKWQVKSKIYIALTASILQAFEDENIEDIKKHIKTGMWSTVCNDTDLVDILKKHPQILHGRLKMEKIVHNFWYKWL